MLFTLVAFAIAIGVLVTIHEYGHYWVARRCGVRVLRFSVGFGKVLLRRTDRHGTEWALSAIPLGGYVKMLDDPPEGASASLAGQAFNRKPLGQRFAIVLAGPMANFLLAIVLYAVLALMGSREPVAILAAPPAGTPAAMAGLQAGDRIDTVGGKAVASWNDARWNLMDSFASGGSVSLQVTTVEGRTGERQLQLPPGLMAAEGVDPMAEAGLRLAPGQPRVVGINAGSPGEQAGLREGDIIVRVGNLEAPSTAQLIEVIQRHPDEPLTLHILRDGAAVSLPIVPAAETAEDGGRIGRIGVMLGADIPMVDVHHGFLGSLARGFTRTWETIVLSFEMMARMFTGEVSVKNISGPVTIADYAGQTARLGLASYLGFMALISVSIGILNLLPIPMLDGGHLLFYTLEALRGKPVSERVMEHGHRIGLGVLAALMSLAFFNDFTRLFS